MSPPHSRIPDKSCPSCGMLMVKRHLSPAGGMRRWSWWCGAEGCGHAEAGGIEPVPTGEELLERMWRQKNLGQGGVAGRMARWKMEGRPL